MKTLIITTGSKKEIIKSYLPTLKNNAMYIDDVVLLDYNILPPKYTIKDTLTKKDISLLKKEYPNVTIEKVDYVYQDLPSDRIRAFYEYLRTGSKWRSYDIIMFTDGNDISFYGSLDPLFLLAKKSICYVLERKGHYCKAWIRYSQYLESEEVWKVIANKEMINAGMIVGPAKNIMEVLKFITINMKYNSTFGADQLLLNALIHYYNYPSQEVSKIWNYCLACGLIRMVSVKNNKIVTTMDKYDGKVVILHRNAMQHGAQHIDLEWWKKYKFPACKLPQEGWMNR